ncbi:MAG TPA: hypothetical protein VGD80_12500 [Kofleriaceae bacterium]
MAIAAGGSIDEDGLEQRPAMKQANAHREGPGPSHVNAEPDGRCFTARGHSQRGAIRFDRDPLRLGIDHDGELHGAEPREGRAQLRHREQLGYPGGRSMTSDLHTEQIPGIDCEGRFSKHGIAVERADIDEEVPGRRPLEPDAADACERVHDRRLLAGERSSIVRETDRLSEIDECCSGLAIRDLEFCGASVDRRERVCQQARPLGGERIRGIDAPVYVGASILKQCTAHHA